MRISLIVLMSALTISCVKSNKSDSNNSYLGRSFAKFHNDFEPSGIVFDESIGSFVVASDEGEISLVSENGNISKSWDIGGDLEGLAVVPGKEKTLYILEEKDDEILEFSYETGKVERVFELSGIKGIRDGIHGEALTFVPEDSAPNKGYFAVGSQRNGKIYFVDLPVFSQGETEGENKGEIIISEKDEDLSGLFYDDASRLIYGVFDREDRLFVFDPVSFKVIENVKLTGRNQEGIYIKDCMVYIAEDSKEEVVTLRYLELGLKTPCHKK